MAESTPIGVALIGGETLVLKAVYSRSAASARSLADSVSYSVDLYSEDLDEAFDELLQRPDIGAVIIALSIESQPRYIKAALLAGKHVLSEKPIAENLQDAVDLIKWYRTELRGSPTWAVAENWRYLNSYAYAAEKIKGMGRITGFQGRQQGFLALNWKFNRGSTTIPTRLLVTPWRRTPTHQGGYLLDGGVHYAAGLRLLLGAQPGNEIATLSAFTNQIQPHLPPVDTADMILRTRSGVTGVLQISGGTSLRASEWTVACENGWIKIENEQVTISQSGEIQTITVANERTGVPPEVRAWGDSLRAGKVVPEQEPEAALADLELIELMLRSGAQDGAPFACKHQDV
ncbi:hypothetical protein N7466_011249 [Penicillium verhagenii]|uniref:uncharacterized protein n=1 Tax=Penicillium verhagenii TaxID=1562060 RepID=UPI002545A07A|nr:uncharacterized protein N7466_011249 [Penicillium verhagenii]KAJ5917695.1 hypothetical protein N7466_011249 [Penicillium verhagenii]